MNMRQPATRRSGMTLMELVVVTILLAILMAGSIGLLRHFVHTSVYVPNATRVSQVSGDILEAVVEGSWTSLAVPANTNPLRGLRFARQVRAASPQGIRLVNTDGVDYTLCLRPGQQRVFRSVDPTCPASGPTTEELPYYTSEPIGNRAVRVLGRSAPDAMLRYFEVNADGSELTLVPDGPPWTGPPWTTFNGGAKTLADIDRIEVGLIVQTQDGNFELADGRVDVVSSVAMRLP